MQIFCLVVAICLCFLGCESDADTQEARALNAATTLRFVVFGDAGKGNRNQYEVAEAIKRVCEKRGCDFALYLGDNFYGEGVTSIDDIQFVDKFEKPYADLDFPFYAVLGNHDYGKTAKDWTRPEFQVAYSAVSEKWKMPARYHAHTLKNALFIGLDTNAIRNNDLWSGMSAQATWVNMTLANKPAQWVFAFGHHPYISNGRHGGPGNYADPAEVPSGAESDFKAFVEANLCGKADVYFAGHDHDLQWLEPKCGVEFIISGAGSKHRSRHGWDVATRFEAYDLTGFLWVEVIGAELKGVFYNKDAEVLYEGRMTKKPNQ